MAGTGTSAPRAQRADARRNRERVLAAARAAFAAHGPDASLEDIARAAGVGIGTLYRHFPDRQTLQEAVYRDSAEVLCARGAELRDSSRPFDALRDWLRAQLEHAGTHQALGAGVMIASLDHPDGGRPICEALRATGADLLRRAQECGEIRADVDADDVARMVSAIALASDAAPDGAATSERLFGLMMDGLRPAHASPARAPG